MQFWKGVKNRMFPIATIDQALGVKTAASARMANAIALWSKMHAGASPWLMGRDSHAANLNLPASIAAELARLATIESSMEVRGSPRAAFLDRQLKPVRDGLRAAAEFGVAKGGLIFKPYIDGDRITVDLSHADHFYPTAYDGAGRLTGVVFVEQITRNDKRYRRLEYHHMEAGGCVIENRAFVTSALTGSGALLGEPIPLQQVDEWAGLEPEVLIQNVDRLLLGYFKMPLANNIEEQSPLGVSAYSRAVDLIREADEQWGRILWEYEGSELAVHADSTLFATDSEGNAQLPGGNRRLYRILPGMDNDQKMDVFSPTIRDASYFNGLNNILKRIEFQCALAYGTLSDPQNVDKTAEEIRASKQRSYTAVKDIQKALQAALDDLVYDMDVWATLGGLAPEGEYTVAYDWDDSILNDPAARKQLFWQYVQSGKFPFWKYLVEFEGYAEEEARALSRESAGELENPFGFEGGV